MSKMQAEARPGEDLFPTFFMAGFECSTFVWKDGERKDYVAITGHDRHLEQDYRRVEDLGIAVVREAVRWPLVDTGTGRYDWDTLDPVLEAAEVCGITLIWDLCHYGFPDGCDPFDPDCIRRFAEYCRFTTERIARATSGPRFFTPVNEITFFAGAGTDMGWMYPFARGRYEEFKVRLCELSIAGATAIREVCPEARMVHVDPLINQVAPADQPDLSEAAWRETYDKAFEGWDMLAGRLRPELGGKPDILDIVGVNVYNFSQAQLNADGTRAVLGPRDPRRKPLSEMLLYTWQRYGRPIIIGETSGHQEHRAEWLRDTMEECMKALNAGVDLHGVCLYPCVDIPDWQTGEWAKIGLFDIEDEEALERCPCDPYIAELRRWQQVLDCPQSGAAGRLACDGRVQLSELRSYATLWKERKDAELEAGRSV